MENDNETETAGKTINPYEDTPSKRERRRLEKEIVDEISNFEKDIVTSISELYQEKDHLKRVSHKFILYFVIFVATSLSLYSTNSLFSITSEFVPSSIANVLDPVVLLVGEVVGVYAIYYAYQRNFISKSPRNQRLEFYSEEVRNVKKRTTTRFDGVLAKIRNYVPGIDKIYNEEEKDRLIKEFSTTLFNSLKRYKFEIPRDIGEYLVEFNDPFNLEQNWLDKASEDIAEQIGTKPTLVRLCYYDYKFDYKNLRNTWNSIIEDEELFAVLLKHLVLTGLLESERSVVDTNEIKSLQQAIKNDQITDITLESFRKYYEEVFKGLRKLKSDLLKLIEEYKFPNSQSIIEKVTNFMPKSIIKESWKAEALGSFGSILKLSPPILKLLLSDYNDLLGDRESWYIIRRELNIIKSLISLLIRNALLEIPEKFRKDKRQVQRLIDLLAPELQNGNSFSLIEIGETVTSLLTELSNNKRLSVSSLKSRGIQMDNFDFDEYDSWIPPSFRIEEISIYLESQLGIKQMYSLLFYYSYLNDTKNSNLVLSEIIEKNLLEDLSLFFIERRVVPMLKEVDKSLQVESLSFILDRKREFVQDELVKIHYWLNEVYQDYVQMLQFISTEFDRHLSADNFSTLSDLFIDDIDKTFEELQEKLMHYCLKGNFQDRFMEVGESDIEKSMNALYQVNNKGRVRQWACTRAWESDTATNILYLYTKSFDEYDSGILNKPKRMIQVIEEYDVSSIKDEDKRYRFARELKDGRIPVGLSKLYSEDFASIDENLHKSGMLTELNATLEDIGESSFFRDFLDLELPDRLFMDSLNMQLVSAYMITSKGGYNEKVISQVIDTYLPEALESIREQRGLTGYNKLLLKPTDDSLKTIMGRSVRVGLVPFRMPFEDFAAFFREAYEQAVENFLVVDNQNGEVGKGTYSANLIRIFPSNRFFKQLGRGTISLEEIHEDDPIYAIRTIMSENFSRSQMLEIVATLRNRGEENLAMHKMMVTLLDRSVSLYQIIRKKLQEKGLIYRVRNSKLNDLLNNKTIDIRLQEIYGKSGLSTLSVYIYKTLLERETESYKMFETEFEEIVGDILHEEHLSDTETTKMVAIIILHRLVELGRLLMGLRGDKRDLHTMEA